MGRNHANGNRANQAFAASFVGQTFGTLTVLRPSEKPIYHGHRLWVCCCSVCGKEADYTTHIKYTPQPCKECESLEAALAKFLRYDVRAFKLANKPAPLCVERVAERKRALGVNRKCRICGDSFQCKTLNQTQRCETCLALRHRTLTVQHETVNRVSVFTRDNWKCQHCRVSTPRSLMGTLEQNAPELDHVLPIACGGAHSRLNTQCLCRKCNATKGDNPNLEPLLRANLVEPTLWTLAKKPAVLPVARGLERVCECGCGESFLTYRTGNDRYKQGHENKTPEARERMRTSNASYGRLSLKSPAYVAWLRQVRENRSVSR